MSVVFKVNLLLFLVWNGKDLGIAVSMSRIANVLRSVVKHVSWYRKGLVKLVDIDLVIEHVSRIVITVELDWEDAVLVLMVPCEDLALALLYCFKQPRTFLSVLHLYPFWLVLYQVFRVLHVFVLDQNEESVILALSLDSEIDEVRELALVLASHREGANFIQFKTWWPIIILVLSWWRIKAAVQVLSNRLEHDFSVSLTIRPLKHLSDILFKHTVLDLLTVLLANSEDVLSLI